MEISCARDFDGAELLQVRGHPLGVEENKVPGAEMFDQAEKRDFGCVADVVEHRFAKERAADRDAVKPAGQFSVLPRFERMGVAELMKASIAGDDLVVDPGLGTARAFPHHLDERNVEADLERSPGKGALE